MGITHKTKILKIRHIGMSEEAQQAKLRGNKHFLNKEWKEAVDEFSTAIKLDPSNHVFFSNRSACHLEQGNFEEALKDADECINLNPNWAKGYSRRGATLFKVQRYSEAAEAYQKGLEKDSSNSILRDGLALAQKQLANPGGFNPMDFLKNMPAFIEKIPALAPLLSDPVFIEKTASSRPSPISPCVHRKIEQNQRRSSKEPS